MVSLRVGLAKKKKRYSPFRENIFPEKTTMYRSGRYQFHFFDVQETVFPFYVVQICQGKDKK